MIDKIKWCFTKIKNLLGFCGCKGCWKRSHASISANGLKMDICEHCLGKLAKGCSDDR